MMGLRNRCATLRYAFLGVDRHDGADTVKPSPCLTAQIVTRFTFRVRVRPG